MRQPFHEGELELQKKYKAYHPPKLVERLLKDHILNELIPFIEQQTTIIISTTDEENHIWTSMIIGKKGFIKVQNPKQLDIFLNKTQHNEKDIFLTNIQTNTNVGLLFIDTASRTRYRINASAEIINDTITFSITEAYPNCPKYIQQRVLSISEEKTSVKSEQTTGTILNDFQRNWITNADTFFLGSVNKHGNMDASHRGGPKGFIQLLENDILKIPDYIGNNLFNTLGNFLQCPKSGLLFIDYENGNALQLSGSTTLVLDQENTEDLETTMGTGRYWLFKPEKWIQTKTYYTADWEFISFSPFNP
ncbi:pyridoxamine 5'-phosphate oxidase family protein [uncultured Tenacibaculum sp.]|uniref:pyridoxamine 5'-phosphate oxidase family protein n=1 Tax=uncultured Tenacibaculum sp. TaxID=174713 RepID=UPI00261B9661|nr:pyridoxamine 5'-phosphate oxidase family protein [uncultured Tenacibaculum sp.]